jgi:hypothetical protein
MDVNEWVSEWLLLNANSAIFQWDDDIGGIVVHHCLNIL